jgi:hypothetical protein
MRQWHEYIRAKKRDGIERALIEALENGWIGNVQFIKILTILLDFEDER